MIDLTKAQRRITVAKVIDNITTQINDLAAVTDSILIRAGLAAINNDTAELDDANLAISELQDNVADLTKLQGLLVSAVQKVVVDA